MWAKLVWWRKLSGLGGWSATWAERGNAVCSKVVVKSICECGVDAVDLERVGFRCAAENGSS